MVEQTHSCKVYDPLVIGNVIFLALYMGVTMKSQKRTPMNELIVYKTKNGKLISEQFFYLKEASINCSAFSNLSS